MHRTDKSLSYRPDIDGLRAVAVLLVVIFHFDLIPGGKSGFIGVDVFYVISGYLITGIIARQLDAGTFSFSTFYLQRIRRLAPALFAVLALVMLAGGMLLFPDALVDLAKQVLASQLYVANIYYWRSINYFGLHADGVYLLHTWSLAVEEQFYLVFPLIMYLLYRHCRARVWLILSMGCAASFALNLYFVSSKPEATFYLLPTRAWELIAGSLGYYVATNFPRSRRSDEMLGKLGMALIVVGVVAYSREMAFPGTFALLPVVGAALVIVGGGQQTATSSLLSLSPIVYIGRISYPLYLVHWPIHVFAGQALGDDYTTPVRLTMFLTSIVLALMIYHLIELPVRNGRLRISVSSIASAYGAGFAVTVGLVAVTLHAAGFPQRFQEQAMHLASFVKDRTQVPDCEFHGQKLASREDFCRIGAEDGDPEWLIFGDSHAAAAYGAFDDWLTGQGKAGLFMFRNSCMPVSGIHMFKDKGLCHAFNDAIANFLAQKNSIRHVLMVSCWRQPIEKGGVSTHANNLLPREESLKVFENRFRASIKNLHQLGKQVYVWEPVPGARGNVPVELAKAQIAGMPADIEFRKEEYFAEFDFFFRSLVENSHLITQTFSPSAALCVSGTCKVTEEGNPLYHDNAHVTASSASFWAAMMRSQYRP